MYKRVLKVPYMYDGNNMPTTFQKQADTSKWCCQTSWHAHDINKRKNSLESSTKRFIDTATAPNSISVSIS